MYTLTTPNDAVPEQRDNIREMIPETTSSTEAANEENEISPGEENQNEAIMEPPEATEGGSMEERIVDVSQEGNNEHPSTTLSTASDVRESEATEVAKSVPKDRGNIQEEGQELPAKGNIEQRQSISPLFQRMLIGITAVSVIGIAVIFFLDDSSDAMPIASSMWAIKKMDECHARNDFSTCVVEWFPTCVDATAATEIDTCFNNTYDGDGINNNNGKTENCVRGETMSCIAREVDDWITLNAPTCFKTTMDDLATCYIENAVECSDSCTDDKSFLLDDSFSNTLVSTYYTETCEMFQKNFMDDMCTLMGCCIPCLAKFVSVTECIVQSVLEYDAECELVCLNTIDDGRIPTKAPTSDDGDTTTNTLSPNAENLVRECGILLTSFVGKPAIVAMMVRCVMETVFEMADEQAKLIV